MVQLPWKTAWQFFKKLKIDLPYDPAMSLLGMCQKEQKAGSHRNIYTPVFRTALFVLAKQQRQPSCPSTNEQITKMWSIHTMAYHSTFKRRKFRHLLQHGPC